MKIITEICELLILAMSTVAVLVLICGVIKATVKFVKNEVSHADKASVLRTIKNELGAYVLFSLEILSTTPNGKIAGSKEFISAIASSILV